MENSQLLQEFNKVANFVSLKDGFLYHTLREINNRFSLTMTNVLQRMGANRSLAKMGGKQVVLNIGCGSEDVGNCIDVDLFPSLTRFLQSLTGKHRIRNRYFLNLCLHDKNLDGVADGIILSHVLEHIPPALIPSALDNCRRYLKPGGAIRISLPYIEAYSRQGDDFPPDQGIEYPLLAKNQLIYGWFHRFMYDYRILEALLHRAGFEGVQEVGYGQGDLGFGDLALRKKESFYCVARR